MVLTSAIIGTAGRDASGRAALARIYPAVYVDLRARLGEGPIRSGGAAWIDHLAVKTVLGRLAEGRKTDLTLCLPAPWDPARRRFAHEGDGATANHYHELFGAALRFDPWAELDYVMRLPTTTVEVYSGFKARNRAVVQADRVIAYTWGQGSWPESPGTRHAWGSAPSSAQRTHIPLASIRVP